MTILGPISVRQAMRSLWSRAPMWRFALMTALLCTMLFILFPPDFNPVPPVPTKPPVGQIYRDQMPAGGFNVPLPPGEWMILTRGTMHATKSQYTGSVYYLGQIKNGRLLGLVAIYAFRDPSQTITSEQPLKLTTLCDETDHWYVFKNPAFDTFFPKCWSLKNIYAEAFNHWEDSNYKFSAIDKAAAKYLSSMGVSFPQDMISLNYVLIEAGALLHVTYDYNPEAENITGHTAPSGADSDWAPENITKYPEKLAYENRLKDWAAVLWPQIETAYDAGKTSTPPAPVPDLSAEAMKTLTDLGFKQFYKCISSDDVTKLGDTVTADACLASCKAQPRAAGCWWLSGTGGFARECRLCKTLAPRRGEWSNDWGISFLTPDSGKNNGAATDPTPRGSIPVPGSPTIIPPPPSLTASANSAKIDGVPISLGDSVEIVQRELQTGLAPEVMPNARGITFIHLKTQGIWAFFDQTGKVSTIRLDAPFQKAVAGVRLGDKLENVKALLGKPIKEPVQWAGKQSYYYALNDVVTLRLDFDAASEVDTIFLAK